MSNGNCVMTKTKLIQLVYLCPTTRSIRLPRKYICYIQVKEEEKEEKMTTSQRVQSLPECNFQEEEKGGKIGYVIVIYTIEREEEKGKGEKAKKVVRGRRERKEKEVKKENEEEEKYKEEKKRRKEEIVGCPKRLRRLPNSKRVFGISKSAHGPVVSLQVNAFFLPKNPRPVRQNDVRGNPFTIG
ncbi:hypothetical protein GGI42DRAFT_127378 [Trichoderma sp. SZMC 28013]